MWVNFCDAEDGGNCILQQERNDIANLMAILTAGKGKVEIRRDDVYFSGEYSHHNFLIRGKDDLKTEEMLFIFFKNTKTKYV
jgi:hypothetical protein